MFRTIDLNQIIKEIEGKELVLEVWIQGDDCNWIYLSIDGKYFEIARLYGEDLDQVIKLNVPRLYLEDKNLQEWRRNIEVVIELIRTGKLKKIRFRSHDPRLKFDITTDISRLSISHNLFETIYRIDFDDRIVEIRVNKRTLGISVESYVKREVVRVIHKGKEYLATFRYVKNQLVFEHCLISDNIEGYWIPIDEVHDFNKLPEEVRKKILEKLKEIKKQ